MTEPNKPIERLAFFDEPQLVGARWWQPSVTSSAASSVSRRAVLAIVGGFIGIPLLVGVAQTCSSEDDDLPDANAQLRALELQQAEGWDVGSKDKLWPPQDFVDTDVDGSTGWQAHVTTLPQDFAAGLTYQSWQVPTLLQMPGLPVNASLAKRLKPLRDAGVTSGWRIGRGVAHLWAQLPQPPMDTLLVVDLPGAQAVAVAAALSDLLVPVWVLDGCPHPLGVVPWQRTLGAMLYLLPEFNRQKARRPLAAPPMLVLDGQRLAPYSDEASQFDNRSLAQLPQPQQLQSAGIARVLLLTDLTHDRDDLNTQLEAMVAKGIDVRLLHAGDFSGALRQVPGDAQTMELTAEELQSLESGVPAGLFDPMLRCRFGPSPAHELAFWHMLGWHLAAQPLPPGVYPTPTMAWRIAPRYSGALRVGSVRYGRWRPYSRSFGSSSSRSGSWTRSGGSSFG